MGFRDKIILKDSMSYIKHFAEGSENYQCFRPNYPQSLFDYLGSLVKTHDLAWDCGTGTGQAAVSLAKTFKQVIATDINQAQLNVASKQDNIQYLCCPADKTPIASSSINLVTVAQALHWFNFERFYTEVKRVGKPESIIAVWCYSLGTIEKNIDAVIHHLYEDILGDAYWPPERRFIDANYQTIPFPFKEIIAPAFSMQKQFTLDTFIGYLNTWSAVKQFIQQQQRNPMDEILPALKQAWGDLQQEKTMTWQLPLRVGILD